MMERRLSLTVFTPAALTKMKGKCCYHHTPDSSDSAIILTSQTRKGGTFKFHRNFLFHYFSHRKSLNSTVIYDYL